MNTNGLRPVQFTFVMDEDEEPIDGFTDDTYWNGFLNVQVTPDVHKRLNELYQSDFETSEIHRIQPNDRGLIDYGGGAVIVMEYMP